MTYCLVQAISPDLTKLQWFFIQNLTKINHDVKIIKGTQEEFLKASKNCGYVLGITKANEVIFKELTLPNIVKNKLIRAIPYALEEFIAEDINQLHFTVLKSKSSSKNKHTIAYIKKNIITQWHDLFSKIKNTAYLISPIHLLTWKQEEWTLIIGKKKFWLRESQLTGVSLYKECLQSVLKELIEKNIKEQFIKIIPVENSKTEEIVGLLKKHRVRYKIEPKIKNLYESFDFTSVNFENVNLLMNEFSLRSNNNKIRKIYSLSILSIFFTVICATCLKFNFLYELKKKQKLIEQYTLIQYQKVFPEATTVQLFNKKLNTALKVTSLPLPDHFLQLLSALEKAKPQLNSIHMKSIIYSNKNLKVTVTLEDINLFNQLQDLLSQAGIKTNNIRTKQTPPYTEINFEMHSME